ncbi:MAG: M20/M25/M40 family metallo-hydrolase [Deltaproteobacteria bacterium]|nr:M20/M25/M40 family metallo-hydrolase [Deltaproteobacteria bacterium]
MKPVIRPSSRAFVALALLGGACGTAPPTPQPRRAPIRAVEPAATEVSDAEWAGACQGEPRQRVERFRRLAIRRARFRRQRDDEMRLTAWAPPERPRPEALSAASAVIQTIAHHCAPDEVLALTSRLVGFQTVFAIAPPADNPAFREMAAFLERWAQQAGLGFSISGAHDAYEIVLRGDPARPGRRLALVAHGDVVPVNDPPAPSAPDVVPSGWTFPPFRAVVREGRLLGRGAEDDKGPIAAAMVGMALLREAGIVPAGDVVLVIGTGEEADWDGMRRYVESAPRADRVVSIDSEFPVVAAESGFVAWGLEVPMERSPRRSGRRPRALDVRGGLFLTQVPGDAELTLAPSGETAEALVQRARRLADEELASRRSTNAAAPWRIEVAVRPEPPAPAGAARGTGGPRVVVSTHGAAVHSSAADEGHNALWLLAAMARRLDVAPGAIRSMLDVVAEHFDGDHHGERLGVAYEDDLMGRLVASPTVLKVESGKVVLKVNMRRPRGRTREEFGASLAQALARIRVIHPEVAQAAEIYVGDPHVADTSGPLVRTLLAIWRDHTGQEGELQSSRGGTYARLFPGAVNFGPSFPGTEYRGHAPDEWISLEALNRTTELYLDAMLRLGVAP